MHVLRLQGWLPVNRRLLKWTGMVLAVTVVVAFAAAVALWAKANASVSGVELPPTQAAAMFAATSGDSTNDMRAIGDEAKLINASLPFSSDPNLSARPFLVTVIGLDARRAELCLTQAIYYEAGFEPADGRRAVAQVILNRVRHPAYPKSICGVVYQKSPSNTCQFTFVCDGSLYRAPVRVPWEEAQAIARAALAGHVEASVGLATHYHADYVAPRWAPMLAKIAKLGQHIFYRWHGAWGRPPAFSGRYVGEPLDPQTIHPAGRAFELADSNVQGDLALAGEPIDRATYVGAELTDMWKNWAPSLPGQEVDQADSLLAKQNDHSIPVDSKTAAAAPAIVTAP